MVYLMFLLLLDINNFKIFLFAIFPDFWVFIRIFLIFPDFLILGNFPYFFMFFRIFRIFFFPLVWGWGLARLQTMFVKQLPAMCQRQPYFITIYHIDFQNICPPSPTSSTPNLPTPAHVIGPEWGGVGGVCKKKNIAPLLFFDNTEF